MKHLLQPEFQPFTTKKVVISVEETNLDDVLIEIETGKDFSDCYVVRLNRKELHSFIGTLLHVQQKMKGGK